MCAAVGSVGRQVTDGMTDRLAAVGGTLHILSQPGLGTTVSGRLPVAAVTERGR